MTEAPSITEGFEKFGKHGRAFVVRGTKDLSFDIQEFAQAARERDTHGDAWTIGCERVPDVRLARLVLGALIAHTNNVVTPSFSRRCSALEDWKADKLNVSFLDNSIKGLVKDDKISPALAPYGITPATLQLILSRDGHYTAFHQDSPYGNGDSASGGGWMFLAEGRKVWHLVSFEDCCEHLFDPARKCLRDLPTEGPALAATTPCYPFAHSISTSTLLFLFARRAAVRRRPRAVGQGSAGAPGFRRQSQRPIALSPYRPFA